MGFEQLAVLKEQLAKQSKARPHKASAPGKPQHQQAKPQQQAKSTQAKSQPQQAKPQSGKPAQAPKHARPARPHRGPRVAAAAAIEAKASEAKPAEAKITDPAVLTIRKLQNRFPLAFPKKPASKVPLKVGIFKELVALAGELALTEAELRDAIKIWCRGSRYWSCLVEGAPRVDLSGEAAGAVSAEDAVRARSSETNRIAKAARKAGQGAEEPAPVATDAAGSTAIAAEPETAPAAVAPVAAATEAATPAPAAPEAAA
ncbi:ProQ/FinO family protein [Caballeronia humi]|uniref:ProQ activator of osmoprotectant transporter ProP n=1 Tax=Caballeronia humi TaxID=326474 RepID=A0A158IXG3_9BURK|nr:ProQ/FinO family protein [Caballeronia humi]SAL61175.1 ProQ activator of osmoprotectant transporter ProP [Caballeronia humi]